MSTGDDASPQQSCWVGRVIDVKESKMQIRISVPLMVSNMCFYSISLVSIMYAGHLGELELAGATLGNSWGTTTGMALMIGLSSALETLCGQSYGAGHYTKLGIYLQSSIIINTIFSVLISIFWYFTEPVLISLKQDPDVAKMAAIYLKFLIPGLFFFSYIECILRFLQTQSIVIPLVICSIISLILNVGIAYILIHILCFGYKGASLATSISYSISVLMLVIYIKYSENFKYTWNGLSWKSFQYVWPNLKLAIPSAIMVCLEYIAVDILVLLAGRLPNSQVSTSLIATCCNTLTIAFMITYGFSATVSTRVSNEIGAGNIEKAKSAISVTLKLSCFLTLIILLFLAFGHSLWARLYTSSTVIIRKFASMTPFLALSIFFDSVQGVLSGVARGCGWQHLAALTNLFAFYIIGTPLALLFAFKLRLSSKGLWLGLISGLFCQATILFVITSRWNWSPRQQEVADLPRPNEEVELTNVDGDEHDIL